MKKCIIVILSTVLLFVLFACSSSGSVEVARSEQTAPTDTYAYLTDNGTVLHLTNDNSKGVLVNINSNNEWTEECSIFEKEEYEKEDGSKGYYTNLEKIKKIKIDNKIILKNCHSLFMFFENCSSIENFKFIDTSNVEDFSRMFFCCNKLKSIDTKYLNMAKCKDAEEMFLNCESLSNLDFSNNDFSNIESAEQMFSGCLNIKNINFPNSAIENIKNTDHMFYGCSNIEKIDISKFNCNNILDSSGMFSGCSKLKSILFKDDKFELLENHSDMFDFCENLTNIQLGKESVNQDEFFKKILSVANINYLNYDLYFNILYKNNDTSVYVSITRKPEYADYNFVDVWMDLTIDVMNFKTHSVVDKMTHHFKLNKLGECKTSVTVDYKKDLPYEVTYRYGNYSVTDAGGSIQKK